MSFEACTPLHFWQLKIIFFTQFYSFLCSLIRGISWNLVENAQMWTLNAYDYDKCVVVVQTYELNTVYIGYNGPLAIMRARAVIQSQDILYNSCEVPWHKFASGSRFWSSKNDTSGKHALVFPILWHTVRLTCNALCKIFCVRD